MFEELYHPGKTSVKSLKWETINLCIPELLVESVSRLATVLDRESPPRLESTDWEITDIISSTVLSQVLYQTFKWLTIDESAHLIPTALPVTVLDECGTNIPSLNRRQNLCLLILISYVKIYTLLSHDLHRTLCRKQAGSVTLFNKWADRCRDVQWFSQGYL